MSPRFIKVILFLFVIGILFWTTYALIGKVGTWHPKINTAGKIIYLSDADVEAKSHVWIIGSDGTGAKDLTPGVQTCADPVFSPDGSEIAYISDKDGSAQVYVMGADGSVAHAVTFGSAEKELPEFSPDGGTLSYLTQGTLTSLDLDTKDTQLLLPPPTNATSSATSALIDVTHAPVIKYAWSPSSTSGSAKQPSIAAVQDSEDGSLQVLGILPTLNSQPKYIMVATDISLTWKPDGSQIYVAILGGKIGPNHAEFSGIVSMSPDGDPLQSPPLAATPSGTVGPADPVVSPDGNQIMFTALSEKDLAHVQTLGIYIQPTDGSALPKQLIQGQAMGGEWSPDSTKILLLVPTAGGKGHDLFVTRLDQSAQPLNLTNGSGNVTDAQWSPTLPKAAGS